MAEPAGVIPTVRAALAATGRPLTPKEAALLMASVIRATDRTRPADVVDDLNAAVIDSLISADPAPAVAAIRRLLDDIHPNDGPLAAMPTTPARLTGIDAAADPDAYRQRAEELTLV